MNYNKFNFWIITILKINLKEDLIVNLIKLIKLKLVLKSVQIARQFHLWNKSSNSKNIGKCF